MHIEKRSTEVSRCKCQILLDQTAVLSAMTYVDLNPIRAQICDRLEDSLYTSARARLDTIEKDQTRADQPLAPVLGVPGLCVLAMSQRDYLDLVDHTGRRIHPGKRGAITGQNDNGHPLCRSFPHKTDAVFRLT